MEITNITNITHKLESAYSYTPESKYNYREGLTQTDWAAYQRLWYKENIVHCRERSAKKGRELHRQALEILGNKCLWCGISDVRVLCVDHINGNGNKERKKLKQHGVYRRVLKHPEEYQCLCYNCNQIKKLDNHEV